jgi:hypothetical protein
LALFLYRFVRNRKRRLLTDFAKKISKLPEVKVIAVRDDLVTVVLDRAPAKTYIHIHSKIESLNSRLFFGQPAAVEIKDDIGDEELKKLVRQPGVVYVREDVALA